MKWIAALPLVFMLSSCGYIYNSEVVSYRTVEVDPVPPSLVVVDEVPVDVSTTTIDYY